VVVVDAHFEHPRLVAIYDALDADRGDLAVYADRVRELDARSVLDVGCGTGTFALMLAGQRLRVVGVDPAAGSLAVARSKPGADAVTWVHGDVTALPALHIDVATMTGNVAQAIVRPDDWTTTLSGVRRALRPGGHLIFETRDPARRAWEDWSRNATHRAIDVPGVGVVENWVDLTSVDGPLVSFRTTFVFAEDGQTLTSDSTLRFRSRLEVEAALADRGFVVEDVRDAPDRPGREFVFTARRPT
jgi:SAM-dependent methyltransferase